MISVNNQQKREQFPATTDLDAAYIRLTLGVGQYVPGLVNHYLGPSEWQQAVIADPPSLEMLRNHAVSVATAVQQSKLPENRQKRLLRRVRALLWLIRSLNNEQIIFSEQVRMLLDVQPESVDESFFQTAHETLEAVLPGTGSLTERWTDWQATFTIPMAKAKHLLPSLLTELGSLWQKDSQQGLNSIAVSATVGADEIAYQPGELVLPAAGSVRIDRLFHLAARWGHGGAHSLHLAAKQRYKAGNQEEAVSLNLGPDQILAQGLSLAWLPSLNLYENALPELFELAGLTAVPAAELQAIHLAEDALQWALANSAVLLHGQQLRPRAVRRYLMANALCDQETAVTHLERLSNPTSAAHVFAPLIGGPLINAWLGQEDHSLNDLLTDPPVPSTMVFAVRFGE